MILSIYGDAGVRGKIKSGYTLSAGGVIRVVVTVLHSRGKLDTFVLALTREVVVIADGALLVQGIHGFAVLNGDCPQLAFVSELIYVVAVFTHDTFEGGGEEITLGGVLETIGDEEITGDAGIHVVLGGVSGLIVARLALLTI